MREGAKVAATDFRSVVDLQSLLGHTPSQLNVAKKNLSFVVVQECRVGRGGILRERAE